MRTRVGLGVASVGWILLLSGCPLTDDYFIDAAGAKAGAGEGSKEPSSGSGGAGRPGPGGGPPDAGGSAPGGSAPGGSASGGSASGGGESGGSESGGSGGSVPVAGAGGEASSPDCSLNVERCNGYDDNCNDEVDEKVCNSKANGTTGCSGFVVSGRPEHGYMLCTGPRNYAEAATACEQQGMRLAWLESASENADVVAKVRALTPGEVWIGATDSPAEGVWIWDGDGGAQFWAGNAQGDAVDDAFSAWSAGTPRAGKDEDCAVVNVLNALWADRLCGGRFPYLCEEPEP